MGKHWLLLVAIALPLAGCGHGAEIAAGKEACDNAYPAAGGDAKGWAECVNAVSYKYAANNEGEALMRSIRTAAAEQVANGQMSISQMNLVLSQALFEIRQQQAQAAAVRAVAITQNLSTLAQGFGQAAMPSRTPVPFGAAMGMATGGGFYRAPEPEPWIVTCNRLGPNMTTCNGN
jgi:hypothetical protein